MIRFDKKNSQISDLVDRYDQKTLVSSLLNLFPPLPTSIFVLPIAIANFYMVFKWKKKNLKELIKIMQSLAILIYTI